MAERNHVVPDNLEEAGAGTGTSGTGSGGAGGVAPAPEGTASATADARPSPDAPGGPLNVEDETDDVGGSGDAEAGMAGSGAAAPPDDYPVGPDAGTTGGT